MAILTYSFTDSNVLYSNRMKNNQVSFPLDMLISLEFISKLDLFRTKKKSCLNK